MRALHQQASQAHVAGLADRQLRVARSRLRLARGQSEIGPDLARMGVLGEVPGGSGPRPAAVSQRDRFREQLPVALGLSS
jgi:hypothetical protein